MSDALSAANFRIYCLHSEVCEAWRVFYQVRAISRGAQTFPAAYQLHDAALKTLWRSLFASLVVAIGRILDGSSTTHSLLGVETLCRRSKIASLRGVCDRLVKFRSQLREETSTLKRLLNSRNEVVAHRGDRGNALDFQMKNRVTLAEIEVELVKIDDLVTAISAETLGLSELARAAEAHTETRAMELLKCLLRSERAAGECAP